MEKDEDSEDEESKDDNDGEEKDNTADLSSGEEGFVEDPGEAPK